METKLGIYNLKKCYLGILKIPYNETDLCEIISKDKIKNQIEEYQNVFDNSKEEVIPLVSVFYKNEDEYFNFNDGKMYHTGEEKDQINYIKPIMECCNINDINFFYNEEIGMDAIVVSNESKIKLFLDNYLKEKKVKMKK